MVDLELFEQNIQDTQDYVNNWLEQGGKLVPKSAHIVEPIEELSVTVEELTVAFEELHQQQAELQAAHQTIAREKQRYQKLFDSASDGYLITNITGIIQEANLSAANMLKRDKKHLVGKPLILFISRSDRMSFHHILDKVNQVKQIQEVELSLRPHNQTAFPVTISVADVSDESERVPTLHWSLRKIPIHTTASVEPQTLEIFLENSPGQLSPKISRAATSSPPGNQLLKALPDSEYQRLAPHLEIVNLSLGQILLQPEESISEVYFPEQALISLALKISGKSATEITMVGNQGMVGLPVILGNQSSTSYAIVQIPGSAIKLSANVLKQEFKRGGSLQKLLLLYTQTQLNQISQLAACKTHHSIEQQFARWLLSIDDCLQQTTLPLTHKAIAEMMGVRRASITTTAQALQKANIISYSRGQITICDRHALKDISCDCYVKLKVQCRMHCDIY